MSAFVNKDNSWTYAMRNTLKDEAFSRYLGFDRGIKKQAFAWPQTRYLDSLKIFHTGMKTSKTHLK